LINGNKADLKIEEQGKGKNRYRKFITIKMIKPSVNKTHTNISLHKVISMPESENPILIQYYIILFCNLNSDGNSI